MTTTLPGLLAPASNGGTTELAGLGTGALQLTDQARTAGWNSPHVRVPAPLLASGRLSRRRGQLARPSDAVAGVLAGSLDPWRRTRVGRHAQTGPGAYRLGLSTITAGRLAALIFWNRHPRMPRAKIHRIPLCEELDFQNPSQAIRRPGETVPLKLRPGRTPGDWAGGGKLRAAAHGGRGQGRVPLKRRSFIRITELGAAGRRLQQLLHGARR